MKLAEQASACRSNGSPEVGRCSAEPSLCSLSLHESKDRHFRRRLSSVQVIGLDLLKALNRDQRSSKNERNLVGAKSLVLYVVFHLRPFDHV